MITRSKTMDAQNDKNNRSDDDSCPGHTVPPTNNYGPGNLSGDKTSVTHPDTLSNDINLREGPARFGKSAALQHDHTVIDGALGVAATHLKIVPKWPPKGT